MGINMHATDSVTYEPGVYRARVKNIVEQESQFIDENTGEKKWQYVWTFELIEEGHEGETLTGWSSTNFGPRAKAREWAENLLGKSIVAGEDISGDDLIGKECDLMIRNETGDRGTFAKVDSVNPVRKKKAKPVEAVEPTNIKGEDIEDELQNAPF